MDIPASVITIVSSVLTLTFHCQQLIGDIKNSEKRITDLERKAKSFATVVGQVSNAYSPDATGSDDPSNSPEEKQIQKHIQDELSCCKEDLKAYEKEVSKLVEQKKKGNFGVGLILSTWKEKVASPTFRRIEKAIEDHQSYLQSLMDVHHGQRIEQTHKDLKQVLAAINQMFDRIEDLAQSQGSNGQDNSIASGIHPLKGPSSDIALVNPPGNTDDEQGIAMESENSNSLHDLAKESLMKLLNPIARDQGSISLPLGQSRSLFASNKAERNSPSEMAIQEGYGLSPPRLADTNSEEGRDTEKRQDPSKTLKEGLQTCMDKKKGEELLQVTRSGSPDAFQTLLQSDASLEEKDEQKGKTPLIIAASLGKIDMVQQLLAHGANVQAVDRKGATALHNAVESTSWPVMSLLLKTRDASQNGNLPINSCDKRGRTPLHCCTSLPCAEDSMKEAVKELITYDADIDARDGFDVPPIYYAIKNRRYSVVELLLEKGADRSFERPETSAEIGKLLDDHRAGRSPSSAPNYHKKR